jgi:hypothetical protein
MKKRLLLIAALATVAAAVGAQNKDSGVTTANLERPAPEDWLMYSRTYDAQR